MPALETERLLLRPFAGDDLDQLTAIMADPKVVKYLGHGPQYGMRYGALSRWPLGHERLRGWSLNAVVDKLSARLVGCAGLWHPEGWPGLEVGWLLGRFAWGKGFATEAAVAWRDWAFQTLGAAEIVSVIRPDNLRSVRVAERIGHRFLRDTEIRGIPCHLYGQPRPRPGHCPRSHRLSDTVPRF